MKTQAKSLPCAFMVLLVLGTQVFAGTDVPVKSDPNIQNEVSITLVPGHANNVVMAYNDQPYTGPLGIAYSSSAGSSWNSTRLVLPYEPSGLSQMSRAFDPTITADANGNLYAGFIADGATSSSGGLSDSGLYVCKSTDKGQNWSFPVQVSYDGPSLPAPPAPPDPNYRFNDRCQITADTYSGSSDVNNIYIAWIKDRGWYVNDGNNRPLGDIYFSRSIDSGQNFSAPMRINDPCHDMANMPIPAVAPDGTIYVSWMDYDVWYGTQGNIYIRKSTDGGQTFPAWGGGDHFVITINLPPFYVSNALGTPNTKTKGAPILAASPADANNLYLVYAADPNNGSGDEADIFFIRSTNKGQSWSSPIQVNDDGTITDQVLPWMAVKADGTIDVVWYDRRNDVNDVKWDVYIAKSTDDGLSFSMNLKVTDQSFAPPSNNWIGEYFGVDVDANDAYIGFTSSITDAFSGDIYFDKIANSAIPIRGDINGDSGVDFYDYARLAAVWDANSTSPAWNPACDISVPQDYKIDFKDISALVHNWLYGR
jgi:hypothetical protein